VILQDEDRALFEQIARQLRERSLALYDFPSLEAEAKELELIAGKLDELRGEPVVYWGVKGLGENRPESLRTTEACPTNSEALAAREKLP
jgi:hypothetical protein